MALSTAERSAAHRGGLSSAMAKRLNMASADALSAADEQRVFSSRLPRVAGAAATSNVLYSVYVGRLNTTQILNYVEFAVTTAAVGSAQACEVAILSSPLAPNKASQVLTCLAAAAVTADLTGGTGMFRNATAMAYNIGNDTGVHIWAGFRVAMTGSPTQPVLYSLGADFSEGQLLSTASAGVLAAGSTYTGALITHALTVQAPDLRITTD